jgi:predicted Zn-dependent protease
MMESAELLAQGFSTIAETTKAAVLPVVRAAKLQAAGDHAGALAQLLAARREIVGLGGSHAQRDLFAQWSIRCALQAGDFKTARALLAERTAAHPGSPSAWKMMAEAARGLGDSKAAGEAETKLRRLLTA